MVRRTDTIVAGQEKVNRGGVGAKDGDIEARGEVVPR